MFGSVRAAQPLTTPVPSELSAILEAPVRNVLIHINGPSKGIQLFGLLCPIRVNSGHGAIKLRCPLYP